MSKKRRTFRGTGAVLGVLLCGIGLGALAYSIESGSTNGAQVAAGMAADAMCMGGKDAQCQCGKGIDPKTGKCGNTSGGGKIGCPCKDVTSGDVAAEGKCASVGKCQADKADGKPPELPKLPEMPPKQPEQPQPCSATPQATTTAASSTSSASSASPSDPNCQGGMSSYGTQEAGGFWSSVWDTTNPFSSSSGSSTTSSDSSSKSSTVWSNLLNSLGISNQTSTSNQTQNTQKAVTYTSTSTGGLSSKGGGSSGVNTQNTTEFSGSGSTFSYADLTSPASQTALTQMKATLQGILDIVRRMF